MSGLPGAGKDSWIREYLPDWTVISLDELRQAMNISPKDDQGAVGERARAIAKEYMRAEKSLFGMRQISLGNCVRRYV
jgi:predicted kinase